MKTKINSLKVISLVTAATFFISCKKSSDDPYNPVHNVNAVVKSASGDSAAIVTKLNEFRVLAGDPLNMAPGATTGRREVNWDAVPGIFTNANNFPFDFFGAADVSLPNGRKRGLILTGIGTSFRVDSTSFSDIENTYADQFKIFSKKRLFASIGNNVIQVTFKVPGTTNDAFVKGFAVIFCDVDDAYSTTVEYFNGAKSLGVFRAIPAAQGFSFVGVSFPDDKVTRVQIAPGNGSLATGVKDISNGGAKDLVVMDDFIYDEPKQLN
ncbi:MAG: hypothetical protein ABIS01_01950 [Ferruginibacter sp.]